MVPKIVLDFQTYKKEHPFYPLDIIPKFLFTPTTRNHILLVNVKHEFFRNVFFPSTVIEWSRSKNNI